MKRLLAILIATAMTCAFIPLVGAGSTGTIDVTLTPSGSADITVTPDSWNGAAATLGNWGNSSATAFNLSNVGTIQVTLEINGSDTAAWGLDDAWGHNNFDLFYNITTDTAITESQAAFGSALPSSGGGTHYVLFGLKVHMPSSTSSNTAQHLQITFEATAT